MPPEPAEVLRSIPDWVRPLLELGLSGWLLVSIWALVTRRVVTRLTYDEDRSDWERQLSYVEARRLEEREGRIAAEKRVTALTERWDRALVLLGNIEKELIRSAGRDRGQR